MKKPIKINSGKSIFFTGCSHFRHTPAWKPSLYESRGFSNIQDHDLWLLGEYQKIPHDGAVFILGDFALNTDESVVESILARIPCKKYYIEGNHESQMSKYYRKVLDDQGFDSNIDVYPVTDNYNTTFLGEYAEIIVEKQHIVLSHFPFAVWNKSHHGAWNLHSHNHGSFKESLPGYPDFKRLDVGIDVLKRILSFDEVKDIMKNKFAKCVDHHAKDVN